jgi:hypothetical protein
MRAFGEMRRSPPRPASRRRFPKGTLEMRPNQLSVMVTLPEVANHHRAVLFIHPLRIASRQSGLIGTSAKVVVSEPQVIS